jgi:DNA-binding protein H-NS
MNLDHMSLDKLKKLRKEVDKAIETFEARQLAEARRKLEEYAREMGVKLEDVVGGGKGKSVSVPKYRNPSDPTQTWSGRGRKPDWFKAALNSGSTPEDLEI